MGIKERMKKAGGLHLTFRNLGDKILINHAGEQLEVIWQGKNGTNQYVFTIRGPKTFEITGPTRSLDL